MGTGRGEAVVMAHPERSTRRAADPEHVSLRASILPRSICVERVNAEPRCWCDGDRIGRHRELIPQRRGTWQAARVGNGPQFRTGNSVLSYRFRESCREDPLISRDSLHEVLALWHPPQISAQRRNKTTACPTQRAYVLLIVDCAAFLPGWLECRCDIQLQ